jgi:hypothetical protein
MKRNNISMEFDKKNRTLDEKIIDIWDSLNTQIISLSNESDSDAGELIDKIKHEADPHKKIEILIEYITFKLDVIESSSNNKDDVFLDTINNILELKRELNSIILDHNQLKDIILNDIHIIKNDMDAFLKSNDDLRDKIDNISVSAENILTRKSMFSKLSEFDYLKMFKEIKGLAIVLIILSSILSVVIYGPEMIDKTLNFIQTIQKIEHKK